MPNTRWGYVWPVGNVLCFTRHWLTSAVVTVMQVIRPKSMAKESIDVSVLPQYIEEKAKIVK